MVRSFIQFLGVQIAVSIFVIVLVGCSQANDPSDNSYGLISDCDPVTIDLEVQIRDSFGNPIPNAEFTMQNEPTNCPQSKPINLILRSNQQGQVHVGPIITGPGDNIYIRIIATGYERFEYESYTVSDETGDWNIILESLEAIG